MAFASTLARFIERVASGAHAEACEECYPENFSVQENQATPFSVGYFILYGMTASRTGKNFAYQRWHGERIAEETFFYDPAQRVPKKSPDHSAS